MTGAEYQQLALRTLNPTVDAPELRLLNAGLGLAGEAGEVADLIKKWRFQGKPLDRDALIDEAGDVLWYVALLAEALGTTIDHVFGINVRKLERRYPNGFAGAGAHSPELRPDR